MKPGGGFLATIVLRFLLAPCAPALLANEGKKFEIRYAGNHVSFHVGLTASSSLRRVSVWKKERKEKKGYHGLKISRA